VTSLRVARLAASVFAGLLAAAGAARAQPSASEVLTEMGFSAAEQQRVLAGEFITGAVEAVSERDLSVSMAFLVKASPEWLAKQIILGELVSADPQIKHHGQLQGGGSLSDFAGLQITDAAAQSLRAARPGEALNFSADEIAALDAVKGGGTPAMRAALESVLLARYQAYRAKGLGGIVPYDRGGGKSTDGGADLRGASQAARGLAKYLPGLQQVLLRFPQATLPGLDQIFSWARYDIDGTPTFVLTHLIAAPDGAARAVVQRQYYVSTGYHAEQAVAGFLPVQEGTVVAYANHTFTDQVTGFGGSAKRTIGRRMLLKQLQEVFERGRRKLGS
jgi:hypothetical protein